MARPTNASTGETAARLNALAELLAQGSFGHEEIVQKLPEYAELNKRTLERDIVKLSQTGQKVIVERQPGSRWVSYRLPNTPARQEPIPERAWRDKLPETTPQAPTNEIFLTAGQAAERLNLTTRRVTEFCRQGRLQNQKIGGRYFIRPDALQKFAEVERRQGKRVN